MPNQTKASNYRQMEFLSRIPALADVESLQREAYQYFNLTAQLPWIYGEPPCGYYLLCSYSGSVDNAPKWAFYTEDGSKRELKWVYETPDLSLIHNMLLCSFSDETISPEMHNTYAFSSAQGKSENRLASEPVKRAGQAPQVAEEDSTLVGYELFLQDNRVSESTVLRAVSMTAETYLRSTRQAVVVDNDLQLRIGRLLDGKNTVGDIVKSLSLSKKVWVPIIYNVVKCRLADIVDVSADIAEISVGSAGGAGQPAPSVEALKRQMYDSETGALSFPAFLLILEKEFHRHQVHFRPFSLLILRPQDTKVQVQNPLLNQAQKLSDCLRKSDYLCRYEDTGLAMILPETDKAEVRGFARKVVVALTEANSQQEKKFAIKLGFASVPEDGETFNGIIVSTLEAEPLVIML